MKKLYSVVVLLWMKNEICVVTGSELCCGYEDGVSRTDYVDTITEGYRIIRPNGEIISTEAPATTEVRITSTRNQSRQHLCNGDNRVTSVYERAHDIDMRYVQDSITSMWRIIFSVVFISILLAFLISYVYSLIKKSNLRKDTRSGRGKERTRDHFPDRFSDKNAQLYFPVINASRTANFLKDLDPIYDYPCSVQSDYEKV